MVPDVRSLLVLITFVLLGMVLALLALRQAGLWGRRTQVARSTEVGPVRKPTLDVLAPPETKVVTFALGCFWGPEAGFGVLRGVVRIKVGYAGGTAAAPTYEDLGDHSEAVQLEYDPAQLSFEELLQVFWSSHDPTYRHWSRRFASIVFFRDKEQKRVAMESRDRQVQRVAGPILTEIVPFSAFHPAEAYQQRHYLRQVAALLHQFQQIYPEQAEFLASTAVMRANGYLGGYGTMTALQGDLAKLGLSKAGQQRLLSEWKPNSVGADAQRYSLEDLSEPPIEL